MSFDIGLVLFVANTIATVIGLLIDLYLIISEKKSISEYARNHELIALLLLMHTQAYTIWLCIHLWL